VIIRSKAPLRISLGGGGTDVYPYTENFGGAIISTTIDRYANVTIKENKENLLRVISQDYNLLEIFDSISDLRNKGKLDLVRASFGFLNLNRTNIDTILHVDAPPGSGLGSSSALTVALVGAIKNLQNKTLDPYDIAHTAYVIEREEAKIKGGMQDQYASAFGGFNFIEFKKNSVEVNPIRLKPEIKNELFASLILCDTGDTRLSANILERQINSYEQKNEIILKNLHSIKQIAYDMKNSLIKGNLKEIGEMLHDNWILKKTLDKEISNSKIDKIYDSAISAGAIGGKLLGAGGGGHLLFVADPENKIHVENELQKSGCKIVKFNFDENGLQSWKIDNGRVIP